MSFTIDARKESITTGLGGLMTFAYVACMIVYVLSKAMKFVFVGLYSLEVSDYFPVSYHHEMTMSNY